MANVEAEITKHLTAIMKLGKSETDDKAKAALLKSVGENLKEFKIFEKRKADLNKRIKEAKSLTKDIETFIKEHTVYINESVKLSQKVNAVKPDTKGRDYFMIATMLSMAGGPALDDYP